MKILVVEDNEDSRILLMKQLRAYGYEVMAAADGVEALQQALAQPPDMIVSDIMVPNMDGYQLCHECKQNDKLRDIPFVFYTATYTKEEDEKLGLSLGATAFIRKPTEPDVLAQILSEICEKAKAGALAPPKITPLEPSLFLTEYNKRIVAKLEEKVAQLENAHQQLEQSEQKHRGLVENLNDGYLVIQNQRVVFSNQRAADMVGYTLEDGIERYIQEFLAPEVVEEVLERYERRLRGDAVPRQYESMLLRKDETRVPVTLSDVVYRGGCFSSLSFS